MQGNLNDPNETGVSLAKSGRLTEAVTFFDEAIRLRPDRVNAIINRATASEQLGRFADAERWYERAIRLTPNDADLHFRVGRMLQHQGRSIEAVVSLQNAARFRADWIEPWKILASVYYDLGMMENAENAIREVLRMDPQNAAAWNDLGNVLRQQLRTRDAMDAYETAVRFKPEFSVAHANLGAMRTDEGQTELARAAYLRAYSTGAPVRVRVLADTLLPVIYQSEEEIQTARNCLVAKLDALIREGICLDPTVELMPTHFYLAYQGQNDRTIHEKFAALANGPRHLRLKPPLGSGKTVIRLGILSRYLRNHTIGQLNHGWIARMPRDKFEVVIIHLGGLPSDETASKIHARADQVVALPNNVSVSLLQLQQLDLDILYFPEIGMDAQTYTLAYSRIAPVQLCGWGHPVTPGLQTLDGFLSTIDEVSDAETHYTEPLIRLPRLAVWYERPARPASPSRIRLGLPEFSNIYVCPQTLFKFHPEFDTALRAILEYDKSGRLVLIEGRQSAWIEMLKSRFRKTMGECYNRIIWIPPLSREQFLELLAVSDVMLDPFPYCGGNTSYEAIAMGTPVVTYPTSMLRGRLTTALYRQMGIHDLVANSVEHYVHIATRLCFEPDYRLSQVEELNQRCEVLFHDNEAVSALMAFFETAFHGRIPT